jgi:DNA-binding CsgD family transcriptional regulator
MLTRQSYTSEFPVPWPAAQADKGYGMHDELQRDDSQQLSVREREILELVAQGLTNAAIARRFWVTETTVKFHLTRIYRKLGVNNRTGAAMWLHREMSASSGQSIDPFEPARWAD